MKNNNFKSKIDSISKLIAEESSRNLTADANRLIDRLNSLKSSLEPYMNNISDVNELTQVLTFLLSNMPKITDTVAISALERAKKSRSSSKAPSSPAAAPSAPNPIKESYARWKTLSGLDK